jgi:hypothetical protein
LLAVHVIPAKAGIQGLPDIQQLDSRFRGNDKQNNELCNNKELAFIVKIIGVAGHKLHRVNTNGEFHDLCCD